MENIPKLFLYSMSLSNDPYAQLLKLTGKKASDIHVGCTENATDSIERT